MNGPEMHCDPNAYCLLIPETSDFKCECKPGYNGTGKACTDVCDGYCENEGHCVKDIRGSPTCRCIGSFTGKFTNFIKLQEFLLATSKLCLTYLHILAY